MPVPSQNTNDYHMVVQCSQLFANIRYSITVFNKHLFDVCEDSSKCEKRLCLAGADVFPLNSTVNKSCNIECCGNKNHEIIANMALWIQLEAEVFNPPVVSPLTPAPSQTQMFFTLRNVFANIKQMFIEDSYAAFNVCKHL